MQDSKQNKLVLLQQMIENAERNIVAARQIMRDINMDNKIAHRESEVSQIVEGTFNGENMVSMDGRGYPVPANYASKSKLVEGDILKLTITEDGSFVYKKISSVETRKIIGVVMLDGNDKYYINAEGRRYNVLLASLTYFKAEVGDEVILVVPKNKVSSWAAVESIIKEGQSSTSLVSDDSNISEFKADSVLGEYDSPFVNNKSTSIENEWIPNVEDLRAEGSSDSFDNLSVGSHIISDDFAN